MWDVEVGFNWVIKCAPPTNSQTPSGVVLPRLIQSIRHCCLPPSIKRDIRSLHRALSDHRAAAVCGLLGSEEHLGKVAGRPAVVEQGGGGRD